MENKKPPTLLKGAFVVPTRGFEPLTYGLEVRCSIHLSYGRIEKLKLPGIRGKIACPPPWRVWIENLALNPGLVKDSPTRRVPPNCCPKPLTLIPADPSSCQKIRDTLGWLAVHAAVATGPGGNHPPPHLRSRKSLGAFV